MKSRLVETAEYPVMNEINCITGLCIHSQLAEASMAIILFSVVSYPNVALEQGHPAVESSHA